MIEKELLRKEIRAKLNATSEEYRSKASAAISLNVLTMPEVRDCKTILAYCSVGKEPATLALISKLLEEGKRVCLPLCVDLDEEGREDDSEHIHTQRSARSRQHGREEDSVH